MGTHLNADTAFLRPSPSRLISCFRPSMPLAARAQAQARGGEGRRGRVGDEQAALSEAVSRPLLTILQPPLALAKVWERGSVSSARFRSLLLSHHSPAQPPHHSLPPQQNKTKLTEGQGSSVDVELRQLHLVFHQGGQGLEVFVVLVHPGVQVGQAGVVLQAGKSRARAHVSAAVCVSATTDGIPGGSALQRAAFPLRPLVAVGVSTCAGGEDRRRDGGPFATGWRKVHGWVLQQWAHPGQDLAQLFDQGEVALPRGVHLVADPQADGGCAGGAADAGERSGA